MGLMRRGRRSDDLLALSHLLTGRLSDDPLPGFLSRAQDAFHVDTALVVQEQTVTADGSRRAPSLWELDARWRTDRPRALTPPTGMRAALAAPLESDGRRFGIVVLLSTAPMEREVLLALGPLASALGLALDTSEHRAREADLERRKTDFLATVSHELRTPMTPIKGYADLLRRRGETMSPEARAECLDVIVDRADHLGRLVEELLLASRLSATTPLAPVALLDLVHSAVAVAAQRITIEGDAGGVYVDARAEQVLRHVVGNALAYSDGPVVLSVRASTREARVDVADHGRGIPADQLERIFEKFHRVEDPMTMTTGGAGLGLYIARSLAEAMGGSLTVQSELGVGSVFSLTTPGDCLARW